MTPQAQQALRDLIVKVMEKHCSVDVGYFDPGIYPVQFPDVADEIVKQMAELPGENESLQVVRAEQGSYYVRVPDVEDHRKMNVTIAAHAVSAELPKEETKKVWCPHCINWVTKEEALKPCKMAKPESAGDA